MFPWYFYLKRSLVFPILLFSSISLHWSLRKAFLSLLAILCNSAFKWVYLSFSPLLLASLLFTAICKASPDSHFAFLHFFFLGMVLIPVSYTMSGTSIHSSSGTLSIRSSPLNLFFTSTVYVQYIHIYVCVCVYIYIYIKHLSFFIQTSTELSKYHLLHSLYQKQLYCKYHPHFTDKETLRSEILNLRSASNKLQKHDLYKDLSPSSFHFTLLMYA